MYVFIADAGNKAFLLIFAIDALNTQVSESTRKQAYEIVYGQKPNYLAKLGVGGNAILQEEDLGDEFFARNVTVKDSTKPDYGGNTGTEKSEAEMVEDDVSSHASDAFVSNTQTSPADLSTPSDAKSYDGDIPMALSPQE